MAARRPLVIVSGNIRELASGDVVTVDALPLADALAVGDETFTRNYATSNTLPSGTGVLRLTFFTAKKSETTTQVCMPTGGTAAGATPTLCRIGLWTVDDSDNGTALVAAVANDTTLWNAANSQASGTRSWSTPYAKIAGQRYAVGELIVTAAVAPTFPGLALAGGIQSLAASAPRLSGTLSGLTDLPTSWTNASLSQTVNRQYAIVLP